MAIVARCTRAIRPVSRLSPPTRCYSTRPPPQSILLSRVNLLTAFAAGTVIAGTWWYYDETTLASKKAEHDAVYGPTLSKSEKEALRMGGYEKKKPEEDVRKGKKRLVELPPADSDDVAEPATGIIFPSTVSPLSLGSSLREPLRLIGLGVRTVSFLSVRVYAAGFYVDPSALRTIKDVSGWEDKVAKEQLLAKAAAVPAINGITPESPGGESLFRALLDSPSHFAIQITPTRGTDFAHLRDGFYRSVLSRMKIASASGQLSEQESERVASSLNTLKSFFPSGVSVPKGRSLLLTKTASSSLVVEYDGRTLGELRDPFVARELLLAYFADKSPISEKLKASVAEGLEKILTPQEVQS